MCTSSLLEMLGTQIKSKMIVHKVPTPHGAIIFEYEKKLVFYRFKLLFESEMKE